MTSGYDPRLVGSLSTADVSADLEWFAERGGRLGGTPAEADAAAYIVRRLQEADIDAALDEFDTIVSYSDQPEAFGPAAVVALAEPHRRFNAKSYAFGASTPEEGLEAEIVYVGNGSPGDYDRLGVDVRGRFALSILNFDVPHSEPARIAQARGASGLVVMNWSDRDGPRVHTGTAKWTWGNPVPVDLEQLPAIPVVAVSYEDGVYLRDVIASQRARVSIEAHLERRWVQAVQPIAEIRGAGDAFVLLHAHLDTFGFGMTDNATGVVGLLEVARALARCRDKLGLSVRFAWWACHEMPYGGSTWYADAYWDDLRSNCVAALNADAWALSNSRDNLSAFAFAEIQAMLGTVLHEVVGQACVVQDWGVKQADQSFWGLGVPSALTVSLPPGEESTPLGTWFHSEFDTADHVDRSALDRLIRVHALATYRLSVAPATSIDYAAVSARMAAELRDLSLTEPAREYLAPLVERAEAVTRRVEELDGALDHPAEPLAPNGVSFCRALNSVLYTVAGPYGQDSQGAGYTGHRLPGLHQAVEGLNAATSDEGRFAWLTQLLRERNRVADALAEAEAILARVVTGER